MTPDDDPRPLAPEPPLPSDCCNSGCPICVHDLYAEQLQHYRSDRMPPPLVPGEPGLLPLRGDPHYARARGEDPSVTNFLVGIRFWF